MPSNCCGGSAAGAAIMAAKNFWINEGGFNMNNEVDSTLVRLAFIGGATGAVTYRGPSGREYRAGNNPDNKYVDVLPGDVERLLALRDGKQPIFERVDLSMAQAGIPQAPPPVQVSLDQLLVERAALDARIAQAQAAQPLTPVDEQAAINARVAKLPVPARNETLPDAPTARPGRPPSKAD